MRLLNVLCRFVEIATPIDPDGRQDPAAGADRYEPLSLGL
jgi:hypothetical protein